MPLEKAAAPECRDNDTERRVGSLLGGNDRIDSEKPTAFQTKLSRQRLVERLHALGPKPLWHFLEEIEAGAPLRATLEIYAALSADFIRAYGGDRFAPSLWPVDGRGP
jgi:hypothetical protein